MIQGNKVYNDTYDSIFFYGVYPVDFSGGIPVPPFVPQGVFGTVPRGTRSARNTRHVRLLLGYRHVFFHAFR